MPLLELLLEELEDELLELEEELLELELELLELELELELELLASADTMRIHPKWMVPLFTVMRGVKGPAFSVTV